MNIETTVKRNVKPMRHTYEIWASSERHISTIYSTGVVKKLANSEFLKRRHQKGITKVFAQFGPSSNFVLIHHIRLTCLF